MVWLQSNDKDRVFIFDERRKYECKIICVHPMLIHMSGLEESFLNFELIFLRTANIVAKKDISMYHPSVVMQRLIFSARWSFDLGFDYTSH